jgi:hypothetical protein
MRSPWACARHRARAGMRPPRAWLESRRAHRHLHICITPSSIDSVDQPWLRRRPAAGRSLMSLQCRHDRLSQ